VPDPPLEATTAEDKRRLWTIVLFMVVLLAAVVAATVLYLPSVDSGPPGQTPSPVPTASPRP